MRRVDNDSVICVTGVTEVLASFLASFWPDLAKAEICIVLVGKIWPVLRRLASFKTGLATDLATTFRCNSNVLPPIWPIGQFCSDCQELSKFSIYIANIREWVGNRPRGIVLVDLLYLWARVGAQARLLIAGAYFKPSRSGISACTIDRVANIDHNEGDGTSIFWTLFFAIAPTADHTTLPASSLNHYIVDEHRPCAMIGRGYNS